MLLDRSFWLNSGINAELLLFQRGSAFSEMRPNNSIDRTRGGSSAIFQTMTRASVIESVTASKGKSAFEDQFGMSNGGFWPSQLLMDTQMVPRGCFKISRTKAA